MPLEKSLPEIHRLNTHPLRVVEMVPSTIQSHSEADSSTEDMGEAGGKK